MKLNSDFTIKLSLIDISYAKVDFSIFVEVESYSNITFNFINDISVAISTPKLISLDTDLIDIFAMKWGTLQIIDWIWYYKDDKLLHIFDPKIWNFSIGKL